jgi:hypothetical protein
VNVRYDTACEVVRTRTAKRLPEGPLLDLTTASALKNLYELITPAQRERFDEVTLHKLVTVAFGGRPKGSSK